MRQLAAIFGGALVFEGAMKMALPRQWMHWLVSGPLAYMPEAILEPNRELAGLPPSGLRLVALLELMAGGMILYLWRRSAG